MRPTNALSVLALTAWVVLCHRRQLGGYLAWAAGVAVPFVVVNVLAYGAPLAPYFSAGRLGATGTFWEGLAGTMASPSRGLLWYVPVVLLVPVGVAVRLRGRRFDPLDAALLGILLAHWLLIASWGDWLGGSAYGPRFFTDVLPIFAYFAILGVAALLRDVRRHRRGAEPGLGLERPADVPRGARPGPPRAHLHRRRRRLQRVTAIERAGRPAPVRPG